MSVVEDLQVISLRDVLLETHEFRVRSIRRWFSKTFNTPLATVENDLPLEYVLTHYFEDLYSNMEPDELEEAKKLLLETYEQRVSRLKAEDAEATFLEEFHRSIEREAAQKQKQKSSSDEPIANQKVEPSLRVPEGRLPDTLPKDMPPDISMTFTTKEELERRMEEFGKVPVPKKQQS